MSIPEDTPIFWRELAALRSNETLYASALDEFMNRVFFPRRKKDTAQPQKQAGMFNFLKTPPAVASVAGANSLSLGSGLGLGLASPTAASSMGMGSGGAGLSSSTSAAAVERITAAQASFDMAKNKSFLDSYASRASDKTRGNQPVHEIATLIQQLSLHKSFLDDRLESFEKYPTQFADALSAVSHKLSEHDETKRQVLVKLTKYLSHKVGTNVEKALEQEKKIRTRRQLMSSLRFDASCDLKRLQHNEELNALKPLASALQLYWEFFEQGYKLMQPMSNQIEALQRYVAGLEENAERQSQSFAMSKRMYESALVSASMASGANSAATAALTSSLQGNGGGTGIRDLDAFARAAAGGAVSKATEKEGYLYLPAPNFHPVYATLSKGRIHLNRESCNLPDLSLDLVICTVKENRDAKLRWVFNIISPSETLLLQADSAEGYQDWMNTIQNAIGQQLNAGQSRPTANAAGSAGGGAVSPSAAASPSSAASPPHAAGAYAASSPSPASSASPGGYASSPSSNAGSGSAHAVGAGSLFGKASDGSTSSEALSILRSVAGNDTCADCSARDPDWVSLNLGIVICMECSGVHRALGVHISKVRSTTLDKLDNYMVNYLRSVGNVNARSIWEALLQSDGGKKSRPNPGSNAAMREMWIRGKYDLRSFLAPNREKDLGKLNAQMFTAVEHGDLVGLLQALAWGANPAWANPAAENRTALHQAVMYSNLVIVECVIQFMPKGDLNQKELRGWTAIHYAAYQNDKALVELLILRGGSQLACQCTHASTEGSRSSQQQPVHAEATAHVQGTATIHCSLLLFLSFVFAPRFAGELDAGGNTPLASALAQCAASGEAIVPEVQQLLAAAEEKVRARNAR